MGSEERLLPILCGYFNKIVQSFLNKHKQTTLEYLLLRRKGRVFDLLMKHMDCHSLATLTIELLQVQIKSEAPDSKKSKLAFYNSDGSDAENAEEEGEAEGALSPDQLQMKQVLAQKGTKVVEGLLEALSASNPADLEQTLNASAILLDFCENDACFALLSSGEALQRLIQICCQGDRNRQNLPYALHLLASIIAQFGDADKPISEARKAEIQQIFAAAFPDMAYNCVLLLRQQHDFAAYTNQAAKPTPRIGVTRIRAIELLRTLLVALGKTADVKDAKSLSPLLRKKVIEAMLFMLRTFPFCSISHQQAIMILNAIKEAFDAEDIQLLKEFVQTELQERPEFQFPSGLRTSATNMGQVIQIAFELRNLTQQQIDDESSDADEEDPAMNQAQVARHQQMSQWVKFCKTKVDKIEKVWKRKLEESTDDAASAGSDKPPSDDDEDDDNALSHEDLVSKMLENIGNRNRGILSRSHTELRKGGDHESAALAEVVAQNLAAAKESKDDSDLKDKEFANNNYWRVDTAQYDLDELMAEAGM